MINKKILVVDDSPTFCATIEAVLSIAGFAVITAPDGEKGLETVYREFPDLIIIDCIMPGMDGYALAEKIRGNPALSNTSLIMLTARASDEDEIRGLRLGIDSYLTKPIKAPLLMERVKAVFERKLASSSASRLSLLPGNEAIRREVEKRIAEGSPFAAMYVDLTNFKAFNDKYGFTAGDAVIKHIVAVFKKALSQYPCPENYLGHIGGDDFVLLTAADRYDAVAQVIIDDFERSVADYYDAADRAAGCMLTVDCKGHEQRFSYLTLSIGVVSTAESRIETYPRLGQRLMELKDSAKGYGKSTFVVDRQKQL